MRPSISRHRPSELLMQYLDLALMLSKTRNEQAAMAAYQRAVFMLNSFSFPPYQRQLLEEKLRSLRSEVNINHVNPR